MSDDSGGSRSRALFCRFKGCESKLLKNAGQKARAKGTINRFETFFFDKGAGAYVAPLTCGIFANKLHLFACLRARLLHITAILHLLIYLL